jgi:cyclophilin family peptidyl-prolyl cis-trans isomerase
MIERQFINGGEQMRRFLLLCMVAIMTAAVSGAADAAADLTGIDKENVLYLDLKDGRVTILLRPDKAPKTVARIKELTRQGFYDGLKFHRVIEGFMAQTGDPKGDGTGGSGQKLPAEFNDLPHLRGAVSMARAADPNSADSQFFIVFAPSFFLDGQYTVFGRVIDGMEFVDNIKRGDPQRNGTVADPDVIVKMQVAADVDE